MTEKNSFGPKCHGCVFFFIVYVPKTDPKLTLPQAGTGSRAAKVADVAASSSATLLEAAAVVKALASVSVPSSTPRDDRDAQSDKGSDKAEMVCANKAARKKEKKIGRASCRERV